MSEKRFLGVLLGLAAAVWLPVAAQDRQPDPKAVALMRDVYAHRETWDAEFPGFEARATAFYREREYAGNVRVGPDFAVTTTLKEPEPERWLRETLSSIVEHRRATRFETGDGRYPLSLGPEDGHPAGRLVLLHDATQSSYRVRDGEIRQVNRAAGRRLRFTIDVLETQPSEAGRRLPRVFTVSYFEGDGGRLQKTETCRETYRKVGAYHLPESRHQAIAEDGGAWSAGFRLEEHHLLR